jgi:tRNA dimethylallyltransferase
MMQDGLLDEVKKLLPFQYLNALQTVGYKEIFAYLNGDTTLAEAITAIKISTRQYAKRQMTWFKKDAETIWCNPDFEEVLSSIKTQFAAFKLDT